METPFGETYESFKCRNISNPMSMSFMFLNLDVTFCVYTLCACFHPSLAVTYLKMKVKVKIHRLNVKWKSTVVNFTAVDYVVNAQWIRMTSFKGRDDLESFQLEISGFLKEMACPYSVLVSGDIKERLTKKDDCLKLLCKWSSLGHFRACVQRPFVFPDQKLYSLIIETSDSLHTGKAFVLDERIALS